MLGADLLLRELNHRVKNNFQIIASLMNLKKRTLPLECREDIRFLEEHVMAMAVAYRLIYATGDMAEVAMVDLVGETLLGLRQIADLPDERLIVDTCDLHAMIRLDQGIALGLYLAAVVPHYLDKARSAGAVTLVRGRSDGREVTLSVECRGGPAIALDVLGTRLAPAYVAQLKAVSLPGRSTGERRISFAVA